MGGVWGGNEAESGQSATPERRDASMTDLWSSDSMIPAAPSHRGGESLLSVH